MLTDINISQKSYVDKIISKILPIYEHDPKFVWFVLKLKRSKLMFIFYYVFRMFSAL